MKRGLILAAVFVCTVAAWYSITLWIPNLSEFVLVKSGRCIYTSPKNALIECKELLSALGATGDIFGAVTSLFSGLALFAVAFTLWADTNAKREARKPLVIADITDSSVTLDAPSPKPNQELRLTIAPRIKNSSSEAALNVSVTCTICAEQIKQNIGVQQLRLPLSANSDDDVKFVFHLSDDLLQAALRSLTEDSKHVELFVRTQYDSIEGVPWSTSAIYELRCRPGERKKLNAIRSGTDDFVEHWKNNAAVALDSSVSAGSWTHTKA